MTRIIVLGDLNLDVTVRSPGDLPPGDEMRGLVRVEPGGSAGTFARTASAEGADVLFFGSVGQDLAGDLLERSLSDAGVTARLTRVSIPTGAIVALQQGEERSMICSRGANDGLSADSIDPEAFDGADHLHVSGYALLAEAQRCAAVRAIEFARERGLSISVDPPPANLIRTFGVSRFLDLLGSVTWLFPNLSEGRLLSDLEDPVAVVDHFAGRFSLGALTLGSDGAIAWHGELRHRYRPPKLEAAESTGAGDVYAATFTTAVHAGRSLDAANTHACSAARAHLERRLHL